MVDGEGKGFDEGGACLFDVRSSERVECELQSRMSERRRRGEEWMNALEPTRPDHPHRAIRPPESPRATPPAYQPDGTKQPT